MFDNVQSKTPAPKAVFPNEAESVNGDIKTMPMEYYLGEKTRDAAAFVPPKGGTKSAGTLVSPKKKLIWLFGGIGVVAILALSGYLLYLSYQPAQVVKTPVQQPATKPIVQEQPATPNTLTPATVSMILPATVSAEVIIPETATKSVTFDPAKLNKFSLDLVATADSDRDGLTDDEEKVLGTNPILLDSDKDGYQDGEEIKNFFSPLEIGAVRLWQAALTKEFVNQTYGYKFLYPASFIATAMDQADPREIMIATAQNEFFYILIDTKKTGQSLADWYKEKAPSAESATLSTYQTFNKLEVLESPDAFTAYLAKGDTVFVINYNIGLAEQAKFPALFSMLTNSFQFIESAATVAP